MAKERKDTWSAEEDAVVAQVLIDGALAGETQKMSITRASHAINRTYQAVAFRWYGEIRKAFEQEFADAKKQSRYRSGKLRSVRVPDHASDFESKGYKLTDKVIGDVLGKKAEAIPLSEMFKELPKPKAEMYDDTPVQDVSQGKVEDVINQPSHYHKGGIDVIGYLESHFAGKKEYTVAEGFYIGNIIKYVSRYKEKNGEEDLAKADFYLNKLKQQGE